MSAIILIIAYFSISLQTTILMIDSHELANYNLPKENILKHIRNENSLFLISHDSEENVVYRIVEKFAQKIISDEDTKTSSHHKYLNDVCDITMRLIYSINIDNFNLFHKYLKETTVNQLNQHILSYGGETLLTYLCKKSQQIVALKYFILVLEAGGDLHILNTNMESPLLASLKHHNYIIASYILDILKSNTWMNKQDVGLYISVIDSYEISALIYSIRAQQLKIIHSLLDLGGPNLRVVAEEKKTMFFFKEAVNHGDLVLIWRLLYNSISSNDTSFVIKQCAYYALKKRRQELGLFLIQDLIFWQNERKQKHIYSLKNIPQVNQLIVRDIFKAMKDSFSENFLLSLIELEIIAENYSLCYIVDDSGHTLFFQAIKLHYVEISKALLFFYITQDSNDKYNSEGCYLDTINNQGEYPSEYLINDPFWNTVTDQQYFLQMCLSQRNPFTGKNTLQKALLDRTNAEPTLIRIAQPVFEKFGSLLLNLDSFDNDGFDTFLLAININAEIGVSGRILEWLYLGMRKKKKYEYSIKRGLLVASGYRNHSVYITKNKVDHEILLLASKICPEVIVDILSTFEIKNLSDERIYTNFLNISPKYILDKRVLLPLSHIIKSYMSAYNSIFESVLINHILDTNNIDNFSSKDFTDALDIVGSSSDDFAKFYEPDRVSNIKSTNSKKKSIKVISEVKLSLLSRNHFKSQKLLFYKSQKNSKKNIILISLLLSPLSSVASVIENRIFWILILANSFGIIYLYSIWCTFAENTEIPISMLAITIELIPNSRQTWSLAFFEAARKCLLVPNILSSDGFSIFNNYFFALKKKKKIHWGLTIVILYKIIFFICVIIVISLVVKLNFDNKGTSNYIMYHLTHVNFLYFVLVLNFFINVLLSKFISNHQAKWISYMIFGIKSSCKINNNFNTVSSKLENDIVYDLHWLPQCERKFLSSVRNIFIYGTNTCGGGNYHYVDMPYDNQNELLDPYSSQNQKLQRKKKFSSSNHKYSDIMLKKKKKHNRKSNYNKKNCSSIKNKRFISDSKSSNVLKHIFDDFGANQRFALVKNLLTIYCLCLIIVQITYWCYFSKFNILYYNIYNSNIKYNFFTQESSLICITYSLSIFLITWKQLTLTSELILLAIRICDIFQKISETFIDRFHFKMITDEIDKHPTYDQEHWSIIELKSFIDIRQCLFKQFQYVWTPIKRTLNFFIFEVIISLFIAFLIIYSKRFGELSFLLNYYNLGLFKMYKAGLILWILVKAAKANHTASQGWLNLRQLYILPPSENIDKESKRIIFESVKFFEAEEFKLHFSFPKLNAKFVTLWTIIVSFLIMKTINEIASLTK